MLFRVFLLVLLAIPVTGLSQDITFASIPDALKENANSVVRENSIDVTVRSRASMIIRRKRVITVLNEKGLPDIDASEYNKVKDIGAEIYDAAGNLVKKCKRKDFKDELLGGNDAGDDRIVSLVYTPLQYPFTVIYSSETETSTTAFIRPWLPLEGYFISTERSSYTINYPPELGFRYKEYNFGEIKPDKKEGPGLLSYSVSAIPAVRPEEYSPSFLKLYPSVFSSLSQFQLEGVNGEAQDWALFGRWMYNTLLADTEELLPETQEKLKRLVGAETDPVKKAMLLYQYMQSRTRYISIQLGIGGWKPMKAKDVERLGYGDCKALSNYMRCMLKAVGVDSYYTVINSNSDKIDMRPDFVSMQGNHVILAIPDAKGGYMWLECTSQHAPFGYLGNGTDDRLALVLKPQGGELVKTTSYAAEGSLQELKGAYAISEAGAISGAMVITSSGIQYDHKYYLETQPYDEVVKHYKSHLNINNLKIKKAVLKNSKEVQQFVEDVAIDAESYSSRSGNRMIFSVNAFNQSLLIPQRYRSRKTPLEIQRGFIDKDEVVITLPQGYAIEAKPDNVALNEKFGEYKAELIQNQDGKLVYRRSLLINSGSYSSSDYEAYRQFREKIARNDSAKIVLIKI